MWVAMLMCSPVAALGEDVAWFLQIAAVLGLPYGDIPVEYAPLEALVIRVRCRTSVSHAGRVALISAARIVAVPVLWLGERPMTAVEVSV